jgi:hypothetical protein
MHSIDDASFGSGVKLTNIPNIDDDLDDVFCRSIPHSMGGGGSLLVGKGGIQLGGRGTNLLKDSIV